MCSAKYSSSWDAESGKHVNKKEVELSDVTALSHAQRQLQEVDGQPEHVVFLHLLCFSLCKIFYGKNEKKSLGNEAVLGVSGPVVG